LKSQHLLAVLLIAQLSSGALGQQPSTTTIGPPPPPQQKPQSEEIQKPDADDVVRITTNLVQVDAVVTDKNGKVVTDLKPEEIRILEDGRQQKITNFSYNVLESLPAPARKENSATVDKNAAPAPPIRLKPEDIRRTIAIVVDDLGLSFESTHFVRRALKKFVDDQMQTGDLVAIIRTGGGMGALQQFTSDKRQLYAAIERVKWNPIGRSDISAFAPFQPPTPGAHGPEMDAQADELNRFREDMFSVGTLGAVSYVVKGLRQLPGRKSILLVSDGFRIDNREEAAKSSLSQNAATNPTPTFAQPMALEKLRRLIDEAGRASVVIYTMNATGLQYFGLTAADNPGEGDAQQMLSARREAAFKNQEGLDFLAQQTGGIAIKNNNDLSNGIRRVLEDQRGYYLIGYRPDNGTFDPRTGRRTFHKLTLKVTRPGKFNVRMRNGFFGVTDEDRRAPVQRTLAQQLVSALTSPFGSTGVHLQLTSLFGNDPKAGSIMRSMLHIDGRDLTFTDEANGMHKVVFDVLAMTFGDNGVPIDQSGRTYTLQLPQALYKQAQRDGLVYYVTVPIKKPGAYQLRVSLRDTSTERIGSASQFVEVPDLSKNRLALSGVVLRGEQASERSAAASGTNLPAAAASPPTDPAAPEQNAADQRNPEASPAVRHFKRGMFMNYVFIIYNARLDKATNKSQLISQVRLFRDGQPVFTGKENALSFTGVADPKRVASGGAIQLGTDLIPGEYVLQVIIKDMLADEKHRIVTQWMDFEIVK
jgi:VWFA-related protein